MNRILLGEIAKSQTGPFGSQLHEEDYVDSGIPIVTVEHLGELGFTDQNLPFASLEDAKRLSKYTLKEGDIVFSRVGAIDRNTYTTKSEEGWLFSGRCLRVRCNKTKVNPLFLSYYFRLSEFKKMMVNISVGATMPSLNTDLMNNLPLFLLSRDSQDKVAKILNSIDSKIRINNQINAELESLAKTLYDYWFLQFEFPNEEGKPYKSSGGKMVWNEELKREIPEGWKGRRIGDILIEADKSKVQVNGAQEKGQYPFFTSGESILSFDDFFVDSFNIFLNTGGNPDIKAYMGKCAYSTDTWCVSAKEYSYILFYYLLKLMPQFEQLFFAGSGLKHLQKDSLKNQYILLPDEKVLRNFNNICELIWKKITNCLIENQELTSQRDFLLPMLMNGQVTFKGKSYEQ